MDEFTADAFVNRDEPIPVLNLPAFDGSSSDAATATTTTDTTDTTTTLTPPAGKRERLKRSISGTTAKLRDKVQESTAGSKDYGYSLQDRLFTKLLQQVIPEDEVEDLNLPPDVRSSKYINRPRFSLPLMANNFRRFNARIGVVFVFQTRLERLLTWRRPSHTLSLLAVCTFFCLDPYLLSVIPIAGALFFVMVPAYMARHPPAPSAVASASFLLDSVAGPPLAPARTIRPASEMSKDFFRNMRDLQNSMEDFSTIHDTLVKYITPPINFSNEPLASTVFVFLFLSACALFLVAHQLPWRMLALIVSYTTIGLGHPTVQQLILANHDTHLLPHEKHAKSWLDAWISHDIVLDALPETREVEIFELQRRTGGARGEWESWLFSPNPYDPLSPQRISGDRPRGTRFFEDVEAPRGWEWEGKKWVLDLGSREWVEDRMVQGVEVEVEGERWVSDLAAAAAATISVLGGGGSSSDEVFGSESKEPKDGNPTVGKKGKAAGPGWEEGDGRTKVGEWRRRRWVRLVRRKAITSAAAAAEGE